MEIIESLKSVKLSWDRFQSLPSRRGTTEKLSLAVLRPNTKGIEELVKTPLANIREVYIRFLREE